MNYQSWNTSSAYKLENFAQEQKTPKVHKNPTPKRKNNSKALFVKKVKRCAMVATVLVMAFMIVRGYASIDEKKGNIAKLEKEYNGAAAKNQAIQAEIDKSVELGELQEIAVEEFGMTRPETYQIRYYELSESDTGTIITENNAEKEEASLEGVSGMMVDSMHIFD